MKILLVTLVIAVGGAAAGDAHAAVAWPGAIPVSSPLQKTFLTPNTKTVAYSTTQYLNALPLPLSQVGLRPHFAYQVPQQGYFTPLQPAYYPVAGSPYFPGSIYYPQVPVATYPIAPAAPVTPVAPVSPSQPERPDQPAGDSDSSVVDSSDFPQQDQSQSQPQYPPASTFPFPQAPESTFPPNNQIPSQESTPGQQSPQGDSPSVPQAPEGSGNPSFPQFPPGSQFPSFPQIPQGSPSFPQFPQFPQDSGSPSFPQFPQGAGSPSFPQFPQLPQFPQFPQYPQSPSPSPQPPSSFPSASNDDQGLNDEDTISVESA